jgi:hypothetical protein
LLDYHGRGAGQNGSDDAALVHTAAWTILVPEAQEDASNTPTGRSEGEAQSALGLSAQSLGELEAPCLNVYLHDALSSALIGVITARF